MSNIKEKYISESLLKDKPKKKLSLMLGDGVVTTQKIHDGAVTEDKLASQSVTADKLNDDVISIMSSIEEGGIPLQQNFGNHENLGISQKFLTEQVGEEYNSSEDTVKGHIKAIEDSIGTGEEGSGTIKDRISSLETAVEAEDGSVNSRINAVHEELNDGLQDEIDRATNIEGGLRNDVIDINNTLTQDLGIAPSGVDKSAHERITDLVEEGIRTVELGQAALDETPVQGHDTTVVTSDGLFKRFADITKELEFSTEPERQQLSIESSYAVDIDVTNSVITEASSSAQSSRVAQIKERLNKGDIIHFEAQVQNSSQMRIVCAFSRTNLLEDGATVSGSPVDIIYNVTSTNYTFDLEIAVPYDGAYFLLRYLNNTSTNGIRFVSGSVHYTLYHVGSLKGHIQNLNENMYQFDINGADDTLAYTYIKSIKPEHTYKLTVKDVNISMAGVTVSNSYTKIAVQYTLDEGTTFGTDYLVKTMIGAALEESYIFTIPALTGEDISALSIRVAMRASRNAKQTFVLEDVTETVKLKEAVDEIGLKEGVAVFPDLAFGDEEGNDIVWFEDGHVKTKNFDSSTVDSNLRESIDGILPTVDVKYATVSSGGALNNAGGQGLSFGDDGVIVVPSSDASSQYVRFFKDKISKGSVITISRNPGSHSLTFRFAYSSSDPSEYLAEHDNSIVGLELSGVESKGWSSSDYTSEYIMPEDGWLFTRIYNVDWASGSSWNCTVQYSDTVGRLQEQVDSVGISQEPAVLPDLAFGDANGNDIVWFEDGHIKTKNFDSSKGGNVFMPYQRVTYFTIDVDCALPIDDNFAATAANVHKSEKIYSDNAFLYLPSSYKAQGAPTRLVMFGKQGGSLVTNSSTPLFDANYLNIAHFLLHLGYALLIVDGTPDGWARDMTGGTDGVGGRYRMKGSTVTRALDGYQNGAYPCVQSARSAYDYVVENYNIDRTGVFGWGYSQGGWMIMNIAELSGIPFLAVCLKSPVVTLKGHWNSTSEWKEVDSNGNTIDAHRPYKFRYMMTKVYGIADKLGISDSDAVANTNNCIGSLSYDDWKDAWAGYDPFIRYATNVSDVDSSQIDLNNVTMHRPNKFPVKIWIAQNDGIVGYKAQSCLIQAMKNAGCVADIHLYTSGNHALGPSTFRDTNSDTYNYCLGTFDDNGTNYWLYPPTYEMAMWFHQYGGLPLDFVPISEGGEGGDDSSSDEDDD